MRGTGGYVEHIVRPSLDHVAVEAVTDAAGQDEDGMTGFAPVAFWRPNRVRGTFLVSQRDAETGDGLPDLQAIGGVLQGVVGGGEQVGTLGHIGMMPRVMAPCHPRPRQYFARKTNAP